MIVPVRCISCGKVIADKWEHYNKEVSAGKSPKKVLDELGVKRFCCRAVFLTNVDLIDQISRFKRHSIPVAVEPPIEDVSEVEKSIAEKAAQVDAETGSEEVKAEK